MNEEDDTALVAACLAGDDEAFSGLVERHRDAVYNLAYNLCGDAATAEDIAQEAFIRAYRKLPQYRQGFSFRNWVLGICANLSRSWYRSRWRRRHLEQNYAEDENILREEHITADQNRSGVRDAVSQALANLPEKLRSAVVLKYMEGMSIQEIADVLGISLSAAKMRLARGRQIIEQALYSCGKGAR